MPDKGAGRSESKMLTDEKRNGIIASHDACYPNDIAGGAVQRKFLKFLERCPTGR
jgi:hypothetical protein